MNIKHPDALGVQGLDDGSAGLQRYRGNAK